MLKTYTIVLERAHIASNSSFIELQNVKFGHIASSSFFHFSSFILSLETSFPSFDSNISSISCFIELEFAIHKSSSSSLIRLEIRVLKLIQFSSIEQFVLALLYRVFFSYITLFLECILYNMENEFQIKVSSKILHSIKCLKCHKGEWRTSCSRESPREHFEAYCLIKNVVTAHWKSNKNALIIKHLFSPFLQQISKYAEFSIKIAF